MKGQELLNTVTVYNLAKIEALAKKKFVKNIIIIAILASVLAASVAACVVYNSEIWIFIASIAAICIFSPILIARIRKLGESHYCRARGELTHVGKENIRADTIIGGIGLFKRSYDSYKKEAVRLTLFIKNGENIKPYQIVTANERYAEYFDSNRGEEVIQLFGTRFPIKTEKEKEEWLCPLCGEFNHPTEKTCLGCGNQILK